MSDSQFWSRSISDPPSRVAHPDLSTKRILDLCLVIAVAPLALLILAPVIFILMLTGQNPVYRHLRIGQGGVEFQCLKLRTMQPWSPERFAAYLAANRHAELEFTQTRKLRRDPRTGWFGRLLRRSSIDELPQLWNILRGDMSLVGPRPITRAELAGYTPGQRHAYLSAAPGITGLWQVTGRNRLTLDERAALDAEYIATRSLGRDIAILLRTVPTVLRLTGI